MSHDRAEALADQVIQLSRENERLQHDVERLTAAGRALATISQAMRGLNDCPTCGQAPALLDVHAIADERDRLTHEVERLRNGVLEIAAHRPMSAMTRTLLEQLVSGVPQT